MTYVVINLSSADRLKEEREAKNLTQEALSEIGDIHIRVQLRYEKGETVPNLKYLAKLAAIGFDIQYIVTGVRSGAQTISEEENKLIAYFKNMSPSKQAAMMIVAESMAEELPKRVKKKPA